MASRIDELSFLSGANAAFVEQLYGRYLKDPASVDAGWGEFFAGLQDDSTDALRNLTGPSWAPPRNARPLPAATEGAPEAADKGKGKGAAPALDAKAVRAAAEIERMWAVPPSGRSLIVIARLQASASSG